MPILYYFNVMIDPVFSSESTYKYAGFMAIAPTLITRIIENLEHDLHTYVYDQYDIFLLNRNIL